MDDEWINEGCEPLVSAKQNRTNKKSVHSGPFCDMPNLFACLLADIIHISYMFVSKCAYVYTRPYIHVTSQIYFASYRRNVWLHYTSYCPKWISCLCHIKYIYIYCIVNVIVYITYHLYYFIYNSSMISSATATCQNFSSPTASKARHSPTRLAETESLCPAPAGSMACRLDQTAFRMVTTMPSRV